MFKYPLFYTATGKLRVLFRAIRNSINLEILKEVDEI